MRDREILITGAALHVGVASALAAAMQVRDDVVVLGGEFVDPREKELQRMTREMRDYYGEPAEQPAEYDRGRRTHKHWAGGRRYACGAYKGSSAAKRATKRGGNPARHG